MTCIRLCITEDLHTCLFRLDLVAVPASAVLKFGKVSGSVRVSVMNRRAGGESDVREFFLSRCSQVPRALHLPCELREIKHSLAASQG